MQNLSIKPTNRQNRQKAIDILKNHNLPTSDIDDKVALYMVYDAKKIVGTIGLEAYHTEGLLRSVCIVSANQKKGLGRAVVKQFEDNMREKGIKTLYLLTTTAKDFFQKNNYTLISRESVPDAIRRTAEFTSVCPSSATVMMKTI